MENTSTPSLFLPSTSRRVFALGIDGLILVPLILVVMLLLGARMSLSEVRIPWAALIANIVISFSFQIFMLKKYSATPGKIAMGLKVVDAETKKPELTLQKAVLRVLSGFLSYPFSLAPQTVALFRLDRRHLLDFIAGTQVMQNIPRPKPPKQRWIIGSILVLYFAAMGVLGVLNTGRTTDITAAGLVIPMAQTGMPGAPLQPPVQHE